MPDSAYNPAGAYSRIFSAGTGAADMVFGMHKGAQDIRRANQVYQFEQDLHPLKMQLEEEHLAGYKQDRLTKGALFINALRAQELANRRAQVGALMFSNLTKELNAEGFPPARSGAPIDPPSGSPESQMLGDMGIGEAPAAAAGTEDGATAGEPGSDFTPSAASLDLISPADLRAHPRVTGYEAGETGTPNDYMNSRGGRLVENSMALSPDQKAYVQSHGVKWGDELEVKLDDGSVHTRKYDDTTRADLTGRWDFYGITGKRDPNIDKKVVAFRKAGTDGEFIPTAPVGTGAPFSSDSSDTIPESIAREIGLPTDFSRFVIAASRPPPLPAFTGAPAAPTTAPGRSPMFGGPSALTGLVPPASGLQGSQKDELLEAKLAEGPRSAQFIEQFQSAVAAMGGIENIMQNHPEMGMQVLQYLRVLKNDREPGRFAAAAAELKERKTNRMQNLGLALSHNLDLATNPGLEFAMEYGVPLQKEALQKMVDHQRESGALANMGDYYKYMPKEVRDAGDKMANEFLMSKEMTSFKQANKFASNVARLTESQNKLGDSAAGEADIALIYNFMKVLDPDSSVLSGEYATAATAGSVPENIWATYNKIVSGGKLTGKMRTNYTEAAKKVMEGHQESVEERKALVAARMGGMVPKALVPILRQHVFGEKPPPPPSAAPGSAASVVPPFVGPPAPGSPPPPEPLPGTPGSGVLPNFATESLAVAALISGQLQPGQAVMIGNDPNHVIRVKQPKQ